MAQKIDSGKEAGSTKGYDGKRVAAVISKIEGYHENLLSERGSYMNACRSIRESIANAFEEAKAFDIPKKELKKILKKRELERELEEIPSSLEGDELDRYELLLDALGAFADTPLGSAAVKKAEPGKKANPAKEDDKDVRPNFLKEKEAADRVAAENAAALTKGIKTIDPSAPVKH